MKITVTKKMSRPVDGKTSLGFNTAEITLENEISSSLEKDIEIETQRLSHLGDVQVSLALDSMNKTSVTTSTSVKKTEHVETTTEKKVETPVDTKKETHTVVETKSEKKVAATPVEKPKVNPESKISPEGVLKTGKFVGKNIADIMRDNPDWIDFMTNKCKTGQLHKEVVEWVAKLTNQSNEISDNEEHVLKDVDSGKPLEIAKEDMPISVDDIDIVL